MRTSITAPVILFLFFCFSLSSSCVAQTPDSEQSEARESVMDKLVELSTDVEKTALDCSHFVNHANLHVNCTKERATPSGVCITRQQETSSCGRDTSGLSSIRMQRRL